MIIFICDHIHPLIAAHHFFPYGKYNGSSLVHIIFLDILFTFSFLQLSSFAKFLVVNHSIINVFRISLIFRMISCSTNNYLQTIFEICSYVS